MENAECKKDRLGDCCKGKQLILGKKIGQGSFGSVFVGTLDGKKVAIKKVVTTNDRRLKHAVEEAEYYRYMAGEHIGPDVHCLFYRKVAGGLMSSNTVEQYTVMEHFNNDAFGVFRSRWLTKDNARYLVREMVRLLKKKIYECNLYCYDIKFENYVAKTENNRVTKVRMVDFGGNDCNFNSFKRIRPDGNKNLVFLLGLIQLYLFINNSPHAEEYKLLNIIEKEKVFIDRTKYAKKILSIYDKEQVQNYHRIEDIEDLLNVQRKTSSSGRAVGWWG